MLSILRYSDVERWFRTDILGGNRVGLHKLSVLDSVKILDLLVCLCVCILDFWFSFCFLGRKKRVVQDRES